MLMKYPRAARAVYDRVHGAIVYERSVCACVLSQLDAAREAKIPDIEAFFARPVCKQPYLHEFIRYHHKILLIIIHKIKLLIGVFDGVYKIHRVRKRRCEPEGGLKAARIFIENLLMKQAMDLG